MALIHDREAWQSKLAALPLASYEAGETVFAEGTKTGRLLILKSGAVSIIRPGGRSWRGVRRTLGAAR
jgi:CRP-like cAMP-binding protein